MGFLPFVESFISKALQKYLSMIVNLPMLANSSCNFCNAFILLCPMTKLFISYYISITRYLATLYQVWCLDHNYVGETIKVKILWHYSEPFASSSDHFSYFFKGVRPSFSSLTCYPHLFRMLGFDCSCINLLFLANDHLILFNVVAHVKTNVYPF